MRIRKYDPERDNKAIQRLWRGIGWMEEGQEEDTARFLRAGRALVADIDGEAECYVSTVPGEIDYLGRELPFCAAASLSGVTLSTVSSPALPSPYWRFTQTMAPSSSTSTSYVYGAKPSKA